jgi:predicted ester cyclase
MPEESSTAEESKAVVRRYFEYLDRERTAPLPLCTDDFTLNVAGLPPVDLQGSIPFSQVFFERIPDLMHPLDELIAEGNTVAFRYHYSGTHTREVLGAEPSGNKISYQGIGFMTVRDGKVASFTVSPDRLTLMQQLGLIPADLFQT